MNHVKIILFFILTLFLQPVFSEEKPVLYTAISPTEPLAPAYLFTLNNSVGHGTQRTLDKIGRLGPPMPLIYDPVEWATENYLQAKKFAADDCNLNAMLALTTPDAVVNYVKTHNYACLSFLWTYVPDFKKIATQTNLTAVGNEIIRLAPSYNGTNINNMRELLFFIRVAYYWNGYYPMDINALKPFIVTTLNPLFANNKIYDPTDEAGSILGELLSTLDAAELNASLMPAVEQTLNALYSNFETRLPFYQQRSAMYSALYTVFRSVYNRTITSVTDSLINTLKQYGLLTITNKNYLYIISNAAWDLGNIAAYIPASTNKAVLALESIYNFQPQWSTPWLWTVSGLTISNDCVTLPTSGKQVCLSSIQNELKTRLFPYTYVYENNAFIFKTGLSKSVIEPLYYANKEVKAQFGRVIKKLKPVPNDINPTIKIILYSTLSDYSDYHTFLFNLDSDNGGIYIEQDGTLYTYQRTTSESVYTLQELSRHEYTHYLTGRYLIEGMWGEVPIYDNNRLVFYSEGTAEFFTGSVPRDSIPMRASIVKRIKNDGVSGRLNVGQIVTATGSNSVFYRYSAMFFHFLYAKHLDIFDNLNTLVNTANASGFDSLIQQLKNNAALNTEYQAYLDQAVANVDQLTVPTTVAPSETNLVYSLPAQIANLLVNTQMISENICSTIINQTNFVFKCSGKIAASSTPIKNAIADWYALNTKVNQLLQTLVRNVSQTNLDWMTCRFNEIQYLADNNSGFIPFTQYTCEGPLGSAPPSAEGIPLQNGVPIAGISDIKGSNRYYYIDVPAGKSTLTVKTSGGTGDLDLYVRFNDKPDTGKFDCRSNSYTNNETCTFTPPKTGRYKVLVRGYNNYNDATLVATY